MCGTEGVAAKYSVSCINSGPETELESLQKKHFKCAEKGVVFSSYQNPSVRNVEGLV
jgi:hypothetical protein